MIETDMLYAYVKKEDWLKPTANAVMTRISNGKLGTVYASRESLHEIYYVSIEEGISTNELIARTAALTAIENLTFLETTYEIDLLALTLIRQYGIDSIFDAYYAATALNQIPDHTIISTDTVFDTIPGIKRVDPRELSTRLSSLTDVGFPPTKLKHHSRLNCLTTYAGTLSVPMRIGF